MKVEERWTPLIASRSPGWERILTSIPSWTFKPRALYIRQPRWDLFLAHVRDSNPINRIFRNPRRGGFWVYFPDFTNHRASGSEALYFLGSLPDCPWYVQNRL